MEIDLKCIKNVTFDLSGYGEDNYVSFVEGDTIKAEFSRFGVRLVLPRFKDGLDFVTLPYDYDVIRLHFSQCCNCGKSV